MHAWCNKWCILWNIANECNKKEWYKYTYSHLISKCMQIYWFYGKLTRLCLLQYFMGVNLFDFMIGHKLVIISGDEFFIRDLAVKHMTCLLSKYHHLRTSFCSGKFIWLHFIYLRLNVNYSPYFVKLFFSLQHLETPNVVILWPIFRRLSLKGLLIFNLPDFI